MQNQFYFWGFRFWSKSNILVLDHRNSVDLWWFLHWKRYRCLQNHIITQNSICTRSVKLSKGSYGVQKIWDETLYADLCTRTLKDENPDLRISPRTELWDDTSYSVWEHVYLLESEWQIFQITFCKLSLSRLCLDLSGPCLDLSGPWFRWQTCLYGHQSWVKY